MLSEDTDDHLRSLGGRLRDSRLERNESQQLFSDRLGVSVPTLRKMENGDPSVAIGTWAQALWLLDRLEELDTILAPSSLFSEWEKEQAPKKRLRAGKRKRG